MLGKLNTDLIANELKNAGFKVFIVEIKFGTGRVLEAIEVSLDNRKVNRMEVWRVLDQKFENIEFVLSSTRNGILVTI
jgi:hypothetical protein